MAGARCSCHQRHLLSALPPALSCCVAVTLTGAHNTAKITVSVLFSLVLLIRLVYSIVHLWVLTSLAQVISPAVGFMAQVLAVAVMRVEFLRGVGSCGVMFCFWLLLALCDSITCRSLVMQYTYTGGTSTMMLFVTFHIGYVLVLVQLILHLWPDSTAQEAGIKYAQRACGLQDEEKRKATVAAESHMKPIFAMEKKECPVQRASFLNRIFWCWVTPLLWTGYRQAPLQDCEVWDLRPADRVRPLIRRFYRAWQRSAQQAAANTRTGATVAVQEDGTFQADRESITTPSETTPLLSKQKSTSESEKLPPQGSKQTWALNSSTVIAIGRSFGLYFSLIGIYEVFNIILSFMRPVILDALIVFVEDRTQLQWWGYFYVIAMIVVSVLKNIVNQLHFYGKFLTGQHVRSALTAAIYRKSLILSNSVRKDYSVGEIVNFMAVDSQRVSDCAFFLHPLWSAPVNIAVAMYMLWGYLGIASIAGLLALIILVGLNIWLVACMKKYQVAQMKLKDTRTKILNEIFNAIKVIKLYAWEGAFEKNVAEIRDEEVETIKKAAYLIGGSAIMLTGAPIIFAVVSFTAFVLISGDEAFSAQVAFVSLSLVNNLARPLTQLPNAIANLVQAIVSVKRINVFLNAEELDEGCVGEQPQDPNNAVEVEDASFSWEENSKPVLNNVSVCVRRGGFVAVVGQVGCGKSSLISAILGELHKIHGRINVKGSVAYVPQEAWVRNETLEKNILFGQSKDEKKYQGVVEACALAADLQQLPGGDQTEIGEKGINLSGGQKQRVSLARAVYADRDVYLLDDPLSAVDVHVGKHLFDQVIGPQGMLRDKTRVLVTHALTHLPQADLVVCLRDGVISEMGTYAELLSHNGAFADLVRTYLVEESEDEEEESDEETARVKEELQLKVMQLAESEKVRGGGSVTSGDRQPRHRKGAAGSEKSKSRKSHMTAGRRSKVHGGEVETRTGARGGDGRGRRLIEGETSQGGGVSWPVLLGYLRALSSSALAWMLTSYLLQLATDLAANIWLSEWSGDTGGGSSNRTVSPTVRLGVYGGIGATNTLSILIQVLSIAVATASASVALHQGLLHCILRCPLAFFDTTPVGRILNRFSTDMNVVDNSLRTNFLNVLRGTVLIFTTIIAICYTTPIFIAALVPLAFMYYWIRKIYVLSSNQLRRMTSVKASPIYSHFGETITGAPSIRAYRCQDRFTLVNDYLVDDMMKPRYATIVTNRWLSVMLDMLGVVVVTFASLYAVLARDIVTGGLVGLAVSYALQVTDRLAMFVRNTSDFENNIVSVERIQEYSKLPPEAPWDIAETQPPPDWPSEGAVSIQNYSTRYRPGLELILNDLTISIRSQEKVGIVGRTGAGKSSMMLSLFRLIEPVSGTIVIDSVDVTNIGLHALRSRLTIIPQDPVLFSGSLRLNLDPFRHHTDAEIWTALEHAHLKAYVSTLPETLQYNCTEGGTNLSVGQRQLLCLARALLRKTRVLVLDEATAAVDLETDDLIQATIRSEFKDCTVLTIAHRISTVMDYDRIMVLENGRVKEMDSPSNLVANKDSLLYSMAKEASLI